MTSVRIGQVPNSCPQVDWKGTSIWWPKRRNYVVCVLKYPVYSLKLPLNAEYFVRSWKALEYQSSAEDDLEPPFWGLLNGVTATGVIGPLLYFSCCPLGFWAWLQQQPKVDAYLKILPAHAHYYSKTHSLFFYSLAPISASHSILYSSIMSREI